MKNFKKGVSFGLLLGGILMIIVAFSFMNFFPRAIVDNKTVVTLLALLAFSSFVLYKVLNIKELIKKEDCSEFSEFELSEPIDIVVDYSGESQLHNSMTSDASSLDWGEKKTDRIVKRKAYLLDLCGKHYCNLALKIIEAQGFVPAIITELKFFPNPLANGKIIALGSVAKDETTNLEMTPFLKKDGVIGKTWFRAESFQEDRFLVFKKDEESIVLSPDDKNDGLPAEVKDKTEVIANVEPDEKSGEQIIKKDLKSNPYDEPESFHGLGM